MADPSIQLQKETEKLLERLGNSTFKPLRKKCFLCSSKCCDSKGSMTEFQQCVAKCDEPAQRVEELTSRELESFQNRIQRCVMDCQDQAKDQIPIDASKQTPQLMERLNKEVEICARKCVEKNLNNLSHIEKRITDAARRLNA